MGDTPQFPRGSGPDLDKRAKVLSVVQHPLSYFALALLILEGFMGWGIHEVKPDDKIVVFWGAVAILVLLVGVVAYLTIRHPQNLTNASIVKDIEDLKKELAQAREAMDRITQGINSTAMDDFV